MIGRINLWLSVFLVFLVCCYCSSANTVKKASESIDTIELSKTACYGKCPVYTVTIASDGKAVYDGKMNVSKIGVYTKKLAKEEVDKLFKSFDNSEFDNFQDRYDAIISDIPSTIISYIRDNKVKTVIDRRGAPQELKALEQLVEEIVNSEGWKKL